MPCYFDFDFLPPPSSLLSMASSTPTDDVEEVRIESLAHGRAKRSTAGNRMRALLDKQTDLDDDDMFREEADDDEFAAAKDVQEDIFDSDFGDSSDEGEGAGGGRDDDDEEAGERQLEEEAQQKQRAAKKRQAANNRMAPSVIRRPKQQKTSSAAPAKRISFAPEASPSASGSRNRRVSSRRATVQSALDTQVRLEEAEARRLQHPMVRNPPKQHTKPSLTQDELINLALDREEENRKSLKEYLEGEEERKRAELARDKRDMPTSWIRWRSVRSVRPKMLTTAAVTAAEARPLIQAIDDAPSTSYATPADASATQEAAEGSSAAPVAATAADATTTRRNSHASMGTPPLPPQADESMSTSAAADQSTVSASTPALDQSNPMAAPQADESTASEPHVEPEQKAIDVTLDPVLEARKAAAAREGGKEGSHHDAAAPEDLECRNLVSLHFVQRQGATSRSEQLAALFGSHVDWTSAPVVPHRNRPMRPRASLCAVTGKTARYLDAKTGVPFADLRAARVLSQIHEQHQQGGAGGWEWLELTATAATGAGEQDGQQPVKTEADDGDAAAAATAGGVIRKRGGRKSGKGASTGRPAGFLTGFYHEELPRPSSITAAHQPGVVASSSTTTSRPSSSSSSSAGPRGNKRKSAFYYGYSGIAEGDEKAVLARALAIPEGTTRSGRARGGGGGGGGSGAAET